MFTDTHCHLDLQKFDPDRSEVLDRASRARVLRILIPGLSLPSSRSALEMAQKQDNLYAAVGIHPTELTDIPADWQKTLRSLCKNNKVKAIGEIGLDHYWDTTPHDQQRKILKQQLDLAGNENLPVVIHFREQGDKVGGECASELVEILGNWAAAFEQQTSPLVNRLGVLHSFSGNHQMATAAIQLGFYIGVSGAITYRKNNQLRETIASLPIDRILIETDSPFQTPEPFRGNRNEPAYVCQIADKIGLLFSMSIDQIAEITTTNANRLFNWE